MKKVYFLSALLLSGLTLSQTLPFVFNDYETFAHIVKIATMVCLSFIMIHVGYEFEIQKGKLKEYGTDYLIAFTAATFPWIFVTLYYVFVLTPSTTPAGVAWTESLLAARFAAPTSAGVLFSMLAAAGLATTWMFRKTRILAIFDDLDTVILMIPLQMLVIGFKFQLMIIVIVMFVLIWMSWKFMHVFNLSMRWKNVMFYSVLIAGAAEAIYFGSKMIDQTAGIHIEVLLPAFVLGTMISKHYNHVRVGNEEVDVIETPSETRTSYIISAIFMVLVGLSMPVLGGFGSATPESVEIGHEIVDAYIGGHDHSQAPEGSDFPWGAVMVHALIVTLISNIGKLFPAFVYRKQASWRERLAVALAMFPRGEVGAGILIISMSYGINGMIVTVSMISLAINLLLTGLFIVGVKKLLAADQKAKAVTA